jgi:tetrahydromethanopterin S-methyltransferase subunit A
MKYQIITTNISDIYPFNFKNVMKNKIMNNNMSCETVTIKRETTDEWPLVYADKLIIIDKYNPIAIGCMWSEKQKIKEKIKDLSDICLIGNTYSVNSHIGIIINIMSNPNIRFIILTGDIKGYHNVIKQIINIFDINGSYEEYMEPYKDYIERIRRQIRICEYTEDINKYLDKLRNIPIPIFDEFPLNIKDKLMVVKKIDHWPTNRSGLTIHCYDGDLLQIWLKICRNILNRGVLISNTKEFSNLTVVFHKFIISTGAIPVVDTASTAVVDTASFSTASDIPVAGTAGAISVAGAIPVAGVIPVAGAIPVNSTIYNIPNITPELVAQYQNDIINPQCYKDNSYTYGSILQTYDQYIVDLILKNPDSRSLYIPIFTKEFLNRTDPPCAISVCFRVENKFLDMTTIFRSNDIGKAFILNSVAFKEYHNLIAKKTNLIARLMTINCISAHIYTDDFQMIDNILKKYGYDTINEISLVEGYYTVEKTMINGEFQISVKHFTDCDIFVKEWVDFDYIELIYAVTGNISSPQHAAYIARVITETCFDINNKN